MISNHPLPPQGWTRYDQDEFSHYQLTLPGRTAIAFITRFNGEQPTLQRLARAFGLADLLTLRQVHSDLVVPVEELKVPDTTEADGLITDRPGLGIAIRVADCLPVYIRDRYNRAVGIAHAGWRGTAAGIAEKLAQALSRRYRTKLSDLQYCLAPCICRNCYEVGPEVAAHFRSTGMTQCLRPGPDKNRRSFLLDIRTANRVQLNALGLEELPGLPLCSRENPQTCYSFRRDGRTGHNIALIALIQDEEAT